MINTRFAVATHILTFLQMQDGKPATSELIASSVDTNPSLIRRMLSQLAKAGMTTAQMGTGGGALLAKPAAAITLLDVYRAIDEERTLIPIHGPCPQCPVGRNVKGVLERHVHAAEQALFDSLAKTTIAQIAAETAETADTSLCC